MKKISNSRSQSKDTGFICILKNSRSPEFVQIIKTMRDPNWQADELSNGFFSVHWHEPITSGLRKVLSDIYAALGEFQDSKAKDVFQLPLEDAIEKVIPIIGEHSEYSYGEQRFRKRQDTTWAKFLDHAGILYEYVEKPIKLKVKVNNGQADSVLPEFWLPESKCYIKISKDPLNCESDGIDSLALSFTTKHEVFQF
jgi:hypothetical protein